MWLFSKKQKLPGFKKDNQENLIFELTEEEKQVVQEVFDLLKNSYPKSEFYAEQDVIDGLTSMGLFNYAREQIKLAYSESDKNKEKEFIEKAIASISKAHYFCPLPVYLYDLACFMEMNGRKDVAKSVFSEFLGLQENFKPSQIQKSLLKTQARDEGFITNDAKNKLGIS